MEANFDLEKAIATWRHLYEQRITFSAEDINELECHLRDHVDELTRQGMPAAEAFDKALAGVGQLDEGQEEYQKVYWRKIQRHNRWQDDFQWRKEMLKNYLLITWRGIQRKPVFASINILGLALGLGLCLTLALYVKHELSYDKHLENADQVYRLIRQNSPEDPFTVYMPVGLAAELREQVHGIENFTEASSPVRSLFITREDNHFYLEKLIQTDAKFLKVFPYKMVRGDIETALSGPGKLVLTVSAAKKIFGEKDPIGQVVEHKGFGEGVFQVTALVEDPPSHTHLQFDGLRTEAESSEGDAEGGIQWNYYASAVYVDLQKGGDIENILAQVRAYEDATNEFSWLEDMVIEMEPVSGIYFNSMAKYDFVGKSSVKYLYLFGCIGLLLLVIACINYINLSTAQAFNRTKEVGVRKSLGAGRNQLYKQFLVDALFLSLLALPIALVIAWLALPLVNSFMNSTIELVSIENLGVIGVFVFLTLFTGVMAGSYPALMLSRFGAIEAFKGGSKLVGGSVLRKGLVVFQFVISLGLILVTLIINAQLDFMHDQDLGFDRNYVVKIPSKGLGESYEAFKTRMTQHTSIQEVSSGISLGLGSSSLTLSQDSKKTEDTWSLKPSEVDYGYFKAMGMPIVEGEGFSQDRLSEGITYVVLNRTAAYHMIADEEVIGAKVKTVEMSIERAGESGEGIVVGVVDDFSNQSLHKRTEAGFMFMLKPQRHRELLIRLNPAQAEQGLRDAAAVWAEFVPDRPFDYAFLSDAIAAQYEKETRLGNIFTIFAGLTIFVACLGIFGLAVFSANKRTKEIGVRKTLGATVPNIFMMLSKDFIVLVAVAFVIAAPIAYLSMQRWLEDFAYRVEPGIAIFALAALLAFLMTMASVSIQAWLAARRNPVDSLRYE